MALTPGFKKFIGLIVLTGAVGGGLFYYKTMPKKAVQEVPIIEQPSQQSQPDQIVRNVDPASDPQPVVAQDQIVRSVEPSQVQSDTSTNTGMAALLKAGQK